MKPAHRIIILEHLSDRSRDDLYATISKVLADSPKMPYKKRISLKHKLEPYKEHFRYLGNGQNKPRSKRKTLAQVGGGPMTHMLNAALPLLLDLYR